MARRQMQLYDTLKETPEEDRRVELMKEILSLAVEAFWAIGIAHPPRDTASSGTTCTTCRRRCSQHRCDVHRTGAHESLPVLHRTDLTVPRRSW